MMAKKKSKKTTTKPQVKKAPTKEDESLVTFNISKQKNFSEWFTKIVQIAELADMRYGVKGFLVYQPWSTIAIKRMFDLYEQELEEFGHNPVIFPSVIPESNFQVEADHVEGFAPEVFWISSAGSTGMLEERLALRPTSETAMYPLYSLWIRSWRDLPLKLYQSGKVWRYEGKSTRPFLRGREFIWIESHNVFTTMEEAEAQTREDMQISINVMHDRFGIPFIQFQRPEWDKFAGAVHTYAADTLMPDGRFLQLPSTHLLGDNFSKAFGINYMDDEGVSHPAYQTCYGPAISRIFGGMIAVHGDDSGLIFPFEVAPVQVVIVPILAKKQATKVKNYAEELRMLVKAMGYRVQIDASDKRPGDKYYYWEMKGVPIRLEVGRREAKEDQITIFRRDNREKTIISKTELEATIKKVGADLNESIKERAQEFFDSRLASAETLNELVEHIKSRKMVKIPWCSIDLDGENCAEEIKDQLAGAEVRGIDVQETKIPSKDEKCFICGNQAKCFVYVGKQY
ncbi:proline--tRNA ligase [Candidatus Heimdallarchaeota archaeon B3_Heim]|nr:MAG: proline--tRNA ligase [Candidatus Heimdallarchaeota archaeon B3_Heim]